MQDKKIIEKLSFKPVAAKRLSATLPDPIIILCRP